MRTKKTKGSSDKFSFDRIYGEVLRPFFDKVPDQRAYNSSYALSDGLKSGFALYSLKSPSLLSFQKKTEQERCNMSNIFDIGSIPSDNGLRKMLDSVSPSLLRQGFARLFDYTERTGVLKRMQYWRNFLIVSIDGVEHFCSKQVSCPQCLQRNHRDGSVSNYHSMLSAAVVSPEHREVFPLDHEPMVRQDGDTKNDCERKAIHRLLDNLQSVHPHHNFVITTDALQSCAPVVERFEGQPHLRYVMGVKSKGNAYLFEQFNDLVRQKTAKTIKFKEDGESYLIRYANGLSLNKSHVDVQTNMIYVEYTNEKGKKTVFSWITNIKVTKGNVKKLMRIGRSRWKIENEVFNTLKNQGYQFDRNFGHGERLCTVMAYLMMMAFWVDQLQQAGSKVFNQLVKELKTRVKLWEAVRSVFLLISCDSMLFLHQKIAELYCVRLI